MQIDKSFYGNLHFYSWKKGQGTVPKKGQGTVPCPTQMKIDIKIFIWLLAELVITLQSDVLK